MPQQREVKVSHMQWEVAFAMLQDGASDEEIGKKLRRSLDTVKTHLRLLFRRTGVKSRTRLAILVWSGQLDLIHPDGHSLVQELDGTIAA